MALSLLHHSRRVHFRLFLQLPGATPANVAGRIGSLPGKVAPSKESSSKGRTVAEDSVHGDEHLTQTSSTLVDAKDEKDLSDSGDEEPLKVKRSVLAYLPSFFSTLVSSFFVSLPFSVCLSLSPFLCLSLSVCLSPSDVRACV